MNTVRCSTYTTVEIRATNTGEIQAFLDKVLEMLGRAPVDPSGLRLEEPVTLAVRFPR